LTGESHAASIHRYIRRRWLFGRCRRTPAREGGFHRRRSAAHPGRTGLDSRRAVWPRGAPIVLLHGFGTSSFVWRDIAPEIALANRTAFAIDLFATAIRPSFDADFGIASQAELVDRALTALRLPKATVVGSTSGAPWRSDSPRADRSAWSA